MAQSKYTGLTATTGIREVQDCACVVSAVTSSTLLDTLS